MRAAAIQLTATGDVAANLEKADRLVRQAVALGAELVVLPEKWPVLGTEEQNRHGVQPLDGPALTWARAVAAELSIDLVAGSVPELVDDGEDRGFNTCVHIGPDGTDLAVYRKLHMFDVEVAGRRYRESDRERGGDEIVTSTLDNGTQLGLAVCYDLRFPELFRELALRGALVVALPSAFTVATTQDHWEILLRARAIENQCFIVAANQVGEHAPGLASGGRSMIVGPWGEVLAQAGEGEAVVTADLDMERLHDIRTRLPSLSSRRPDVYG